MQSKRKQVVLVLGGAGYVGSHVVRLLERHKYQIIVLDNLAYGHLSAILNPEVNFIEGDLGDKKLLKKIFTNYKIDVVMHFAAFCYVGESITKPAMYYNNNVIAPLRFLEVMKEAGCKYFIFSSTCATYGMPQYLPLDEKHPQNPINPYGESKLMLEKILRDFDTAYGIKHINLRYFNASGASEDAVIGEEHHPETHLIPLTLMAAKGEIDNINVFGTNYDTEDGTCLRDYIHVLDLAEAHLKAIDYLQDTNQSDSFNLGTGKGISVQEIIDVAAKVSKKDVPVKYAERRAGDPPILVANASKAKQVLQWQAKWLDTEKIMQSAWNWLFSPNRNAFLQERAKRGRL